MLVWSFLIYEPFLIHFSSFSFYVVGSSGETYHWCCNREWVISEFLHFLCIYCQHTVCLFISFFLCFVFCSHHCITVNYTLRELFGQTQHSLKKYLCSKGVFVCSHLWLQVYHTVISVHSVGGQWTGSYSRPESENTQNTVFSYS